VKELKDYLYYQDELATIYCGDSREIIPLISGYDLVITDPPYGMDYQSSRRTDKTERHDKIHGDKEFPMWIFELLKPSNAMFVWCRWDNLYELPKPKSFIAWDKKCHSMGDLNHEFGRQWEACAYYPGPEHKFLRRPVDVIRQAKVSPEALVHPNEKPAAVYYPILESHAGVVLDPFMGSGSTLMACKNLGRKSIGIEIDEKYCEVAMKRLRQTTSMML
jgi:site-specific DNA-methyltransferase (adenine-specific)